MFKLLRYFSITSFIAVAIVAVLLGLFYRQIAVNNLVEVGESKNVALTQLFANSLGQEFGFFLKSVSGLGREELRAHSEIAKLRQAVLAQMKGLSVVKIKVYNLDGLTAFSTEEKQIGEDQSRNLGFLAARSGKALSSIVHRDTFNAFDHIIENRDLLQTYMPFRRGFSGPIEGVVELYDDVTAFLQKIKRTQQIVILGVISLLMLLYGVLFFIVRHADKIIKRQDTERKRAEEALAQKAEKLKRSNAELEQFAYIVSHDLQEPLRMVASYVQLLAKRYQGKLDSNADEFIAYAADGASRMQGLIKDLLVYSRVGTKGKEFEPTDCEATLKGVLTDLKVAVEESGAVVTHDVLPTVMVDGGQLGQLFQNLIGNAIKFRNEAPPRVHVSAERNGKEWRFSVKDNGIGIDPEHSERIFIIFQRLHGKEEYPGTGIGLAVCKKIVERHGGKIWVESQAGKGATFHFTIPA